MRNSRKLRDKEENKTQSGN